MRVRLSLPLLVLCLACADPEPKGPTVLMGSQVPDIVLPEEQGQSATSATGEDGAISIRFAPPDAEGSWAYRLLFETSGQQILQASTEHRDPEPIEQSLMLEMEYVELPAKQGQAGSDQRAYLLRLDALHSQNMQSGRPPQTIELAGDRLRVYSGKDKMEMDLEGAQPKEGLTPRMLLQQIFGLVVYDEQGETVTAQVRGRPRARDFLKQFPIRDAIRFSRVPRPTESIRPGHQWAATRFPPNAIGGLGLKMDVSYSFAGYRDVDGVRCAWILIESEEDGTDVPAATGLTFDRVRAEIRGEAFIELSNSRLRRMVIHDESRAQYKRGKAPKPTLEHRLRYRGRMLLELIESDPARERWADGSKRFPPI